MFICNINTCICVLEKIETKILNSLHLIRDKEIEKRRLPLQLLKCKYEG